MALLMAMRAPRTEATGTSGQSYVKGHFETLGWGVMPNPEHDLGTDMIVQARDDGGFDLGLLLGVQVKSGPSYFKEPCEEEGATVGWWFREDEDHFNYWLNYQTAHIVVLHDQDTGIAYWVEVTDDRVLVTGKDRKILVPASQTVDAVHQQSLIKAAATKAHMPQWEGSAWDLRGSILETSKLRYALVAPRLLAPHPNTQPKDLAPEQAVALFVKQRFHDIGRLTEKTPLLDPAAAEASTEWPWQFYGALCEWGTSGDRTRLESLGGTASGSAQCAAIAVCVSHAMFEAGDVAGALTAVGSALEAEGLTREDVVWLTAHKARLAYDLGELEVARDAAASVKQIDPGMHSDPTIRVLLGSASELIFNLGDWGEESLADVVKGRDNMVNLWRNQAIADALGKQAEESFHDWAPDRRVTFGAADVAWFGFRSAMLLAGFAADSPGWRYAAALLARRQFIASGGGNLPDYVFELLTLSGSEKDVRRVADRLLKSGPSGPLKNAASQIDLSTSTRTSLQSSISLVEKAGDLLPSDVCDRHARFALAVLAGTEPTVPRLMPRFFVGDALLKMLKSLWRALSPEVKDEVKAHLLGLPVIKDQLVAGGYARLIRRMDEGVWSEAEVDQLARRAKGDDGDNFEFTEAIEGLQASRSPDFRSTLLERIGEGDLRALSSYGNVTDLPGTVAEGAITSLAEAVAGQTASAQKGAYGMGGPDLLRALVLLNVWHPGQADWQTCQEALAEPKMMPEHLQGSLDLISAVAPKIDAAVRKGLQLPLEQIRDRREFPDAFGQSSEGETIRGAATVALAMLFPDSIDPEILTRLVRGDVGQRNASAQILSAREDESALIVLAALSRDQDAQVRSTVAGGLARWVVKGVARDASLEVVRDLLAGPGTEIAFAVAGGLAVDDQGEGCQLLVDLLADNPSTAVRLHAARVLQGEGE